MARYLEVGGATRRTSRRIAAAVLVGSTCLSGVIAIPATAYSQESQRRNFNIPAGQLSAVLANFARKTGTQVTYLPSIATGKRSAGFSGSSDSSTALSAILQGTGLHYSTRGGTVTITDGDALGPRDAPSGEGTTLDMITITGAEESPADAPYRTIGSSAYISQEALEHFRGTSPADIFRATPGVMSGEARNGNSVDVNIRGMQGMGRVPVAIDGTLGSATVYQGYQGVSNRTYIDPDFIGGVSVEKGPGTGAYGGVAGAVSMDTIKASDILLDGRRFGVRLKGEFGTNSSPIPAIGTIAGMFFSGSRPGSVVGAENVERPIDLQPTRGSGSVAVAARGDWYEIVAGYSVRKNGNYHGGANGPVADSSDDLGPRSICRDYGFGLPSCTNYAQYYENTGVSQYRPGEAILNTSSNTESWLAKAKFELPEDQTLEFIHSGYRSDHGSIMASQLSSPMGLQAVQRWTSTAAVDRYALRHRWNPHDNNLVNLQTNVWLMELELRSPTTAFYRNVVALGLPDSRYERVLVGTDTRQWGADIANTSLLGTAWGDVSLKYGLSYLNEDTKPTEHTRKLEEFVPPNGTREEWQAFMNGRWSPLDWLTIDAGLRYQDFAATDRATLGDTPAAGFAGNASHRAGGGFSPSFAVAVTPFDGTQFYARYAEGLRMPSVAESSAMGATFVTPDVRPERSHNWDIGVNHTTGGLIVPEDGLKLTFGWFHNTVDDYIARRIVNVRTSFGTSYSGVGVGNIDRAFFEGLEFSGRYETGGFSLEFGGTYYTDMAFCVTAHSCQRSSLYADYATNHVPPKYTASLTVAHKFLDDTLTLGGRATYVGPRAIGADQPTVQGAAPLISPINWKPHTLVDLFAEYKISEHLKADLRIENLGDVHYVDPLGLANIPGPGRTVWAGFTAKF